jgi:DNA replication protein DnaC
MSHLLEKSIPDLYRGWTPADMVGADNVEEIQQKIAQYLNDPNLEKKGNNLYIYSLENGSGKTSLAYYILEEIHKPRVKVDYHLITHSPWAGSLPSHVDITPIVAVKFANYLKFCSDPYGEESRLAKKQVELAPFLLLDDVSHWALSSNLHKDKTELILLMMYRREHLLPTIITSNLVPAEFDKTFGAVVASKVLENFSYVEVKNGDVRSIVYEDRLSAAAAEGEGK